MLAPYRTGSGALMSSGSMLSSEIGMKKNTSALRKPTNISRPVPWYAKRSPSKSVSEKRYARTLTFAQKK